MSLKIGLKKGRKTGRKTKSEKSKKKFFRNDTIWHYNRTLFL